MWNDRGHRDRIDGAREALLDVGSLRPVMAGALVKLLNSRDAGVRALALALLPYVVELISPEPLMRLWREHRPRWVEAMAPWPDGSEADLLALGAWRCLPAPERLALQRAIRP
ncbi:MAG: hypothetical protein KAI47_26850 [Deltaproteobacteria bacterium]|nr:hypothetical protein [Deltaproteobacteria bacterium]